MKTFDEDIGVFASRTNFIDTEVEDDFGASDFRATCHPPASITDSLLAK